jgi:hypothetical protein
MTHPELVENLVKPGITIKEELTPKEIIIWLYASQLIKSSCSILDLLKKMLIYRKQLVVDALQSEINESCTLLGAINTIVINQFISPPTLNTGIELKKTLTPHQAHLWHMLTGVAGEAGELMEMGLKHIIDGEKLEVEGEGGFIEEEGDSEFYHEALRQIFEVQRETILNRNISKLQKRYDKGKYSDKAAQERKDKE